MCTVIFFKLGKRFKFTVLAFSFFERLDLNKEIDATSDAPVEYVIKGVSSNLGIVGAGLVMTW